MGQRLSHSVTKSLPEIRLAQNSVELRVLGNLHPATAFRREPCRTAGMDSSYVTVLMECKHFWADLDHQQ